VTLLQSTRVSCRHDCTTLGTITTQGEGGVGQQHRRQQEPSCVAALAGTGNGGSNFMVDKACWTHLDVFAPGTAHYRNASNVVIVGCCVEGSSRHSTNDDTVCAWSGADCVGVLVEASWRRLPIRFSRAHLPGWLRLTLRHRGGGQGCWRLQLGARGLQVSSSTVLVLVAVRLHRGLRTHSSTAADAHQWSRAHGHPLS
jgi:hypothetical protein